MTTVRLGHLRFVGNEDEPTIYISSERGYIELDDCKVRVRGSHLRIKHPRIFEGEWTKVVLQ